jgi:single-strand DNA-binding protein
LNRVTLLGRLGKDAATKFTPAGVSVSNFSVATERRWKDQSGEWKSETDWANVVAWRMENVANFLVKGAQVYVEGRLSTRSYEDKDGKKVYATEVVADNIILLGGKQSDEAPVSRPRSGAGPRISDDLGVTQDDCPF